MSDQEEEFLWGAATSSHQIEGYNDRNDWWEWESQGRIEGGVRSGAATDHRNRFREDIRLAAELGMNSYRFSVEWSRIEPDEGVWDPVALEWYSELIGECERHRLIPMLTLHHFTLPLWLAHQGGFAWEKAPGKFVEYSRRVARFLGERVPLWCTLNEPMVLVAGAYLGEFMPPARFSPVLASEACHNLLRAHVLAYRMLHAEIQRPVSVGIAHNMMDFIPDRPWHPVEAVLAIALNRFYNLAWLEAVTGRAQRFGLPGLIPSSAPVPEARGARSVDFIGVNYYTKAYVQWRPRDAGPETPRQLPIGLHFGRRKEIVSDLNWAIHPRGFAKVLRRAAAYGLPIYVTENGIADRDDRLRPEFLRLHLQVLAELLDEGLDIRGYYHWSLLDNFEWIKGFGPRFGLYRMDYQTFQRSPTASALLYKEIIQAHRGKGRGLSLSSCLARNSSV